MGTIFPDKKGNGTSSVVGTTHCDVAPGENEVTTTDSMFEGTHDVALSHKPIAKKKTYAEILCATTVITPTTCGNITHDAPKAKHWQKPVLKKK